MQRSNLRRALLASTACCAVGLAFPQSTYAAQGTCTLDQPDPRPEAERQEAARKAAAAERSKNAPRLNEQTIAEALVGIEVRGTVEDRTLVETWLTDETVKLVRDLGVTEPGELGRVRVVIGGDITDFTISVQYREPQAELSSPKIEQCPCSVEEMIPVVKARIRSALLALQAAAKARVVDEPKPVPTYSNSDRPWTWYGKLGLVLTPVGGVGTITGAVLLGLSGSRSNLLIPGAVTLGVGAPVMVAGIVMIAVDRVRARRSRMRVHPTWTRTSFGLTVSSRF